MKKLTISLTLLAAVLALAAQPAWAQAIKFADVSKDFGMDMKPRTQATDPDLTKGEFPGEKTDAAYYAWEFDICFLDVNGDSNYDLFMLNHAHGTWSRMWLGDGKGKFALVPPAKMPGETTPKCRGSFSIVGYDFTGAGPQDVFMTDGDVTASQYHYTGKAGKEATTDNFAWAKSPLHSAIYTYILADFNGDGFVDAAVGANRGPGGKLYLGGGEPLVKDFKAAGDLFVGFHSASADMNGDGWPDVVASSFGKTAADFYIGLSINDGKGGFKEMAAEAGLEAGPAGGNIILADFNNDGLMDIYLCGYPSGKKGEGAVKLYLNEGNGKFRDATKDSGLEGPKDVWTTRYVKSTAADFDNDGLIDIVNYASGGFKLYRNLGNGKFEDVTKDAGVPKDACGEPCATAADYDNDGKVDLAVVANGVWLGHNVTENKNGWLKVKLVGPKGNPEAAGASVTLYKAGHLGEKDAIVGHQQALFGVDYHTTGSKLHFGLGQNQTVDVRALYPGQKPVDRKGVKANTLETIQLEVAK